MKDNEKKAIALMYTHKDNAPKNTAKGVDHIAEQIIKLAKENGIPIHKDKNLVEALYVLDIGYEISENLYKAIAEILVFIYLANDKYKNIMMKKSV